MCGWKRESLVRHSSTVVVVTIINLKCKYCVVLTNMRNIIKLIDRQTNSGKGQEKKNKM